MALITRVSRLFKADLHAVLDRIEEPDILLKQALREMEEALARDEQRVKLLAHEQAQLSSRAQEVTQSLSEIEEELDVCFDSGKDELARALVRRKLEAQRFQRHLARKQEHLARTLAELKSRLTEQRAQLDGMRQKADLLTEDGDTARPDEGWNDPEAALRDEDVEVAFLREKQKRSQP
jgi:phage shock protein A